MSQDSDGVSVPGCDLRWVGLYAGDKSRGQKWKQGRE